jgi:hypothetical protein
MSDEKKFISEEDLAQIKAYKAQLNQIIFALGEVKIRKENLLSSYRAISAQEQEFYSKLSIKYGDGSLDLNTGEIVPFENEQDNGNI